MAGNAARFRPPETMVAFIQLAKQERGISLEEAARVLEISSRTIRRLLERVEAMGYAVVEVEETKPQRYRIPPEAAPWRIREELALRRQPAEGEGVSP